jgi:hypothetical protein
MSICLGLMVVCGILYLNCLECVSLDNRDRRRRQRRAARPNNRNDDDRGDTERVSRLATTTTDIDRCEYHYSAIELLGTNPIYERLYARSPFPIVRDQQQQQQLQPFYASQRQGQPQHLQGQEQEERSLSTGLEDDDHICSIRQGDVSAHSNETTQLLSPSKVYGTV